MGGAGEVDPGAFSMSMPCAYVAAFDATAREQHARIVARRGARVAHVELWEEAPVSTDGGVVLCVVADDRPGLLSQISAALVAHGVDVVHVNAHTRRRAGGDAEAVDFLTVRRVPNGDGVSAPVTRDDAARIGETLEALALGRASFDGVVRYTCAVRASAHSTRVRFENDGVGAMILTVEAVDRPGLLLTLTQTLFRARVQIIGVRASTDDGRAVDRFQLVELDGSALRGERLLELQTAVLTAIEETWRRDG